MALHVPYEGLADLNGLTYRAPLLDERPWFQQPPKATVADFSGKLSEWIDSDSVGFVSVVNWNKLIKRVIMVVTVALILFGLLGWWIGKSPLRIDVSAALFIGGGLALGWAVAWGLSRYGGFPSGEMLPRTWSAGAFLGTVSWWIRQKRLGSL
jgi:hypothetical protein